MGTVSEHGDKIKKPTREQGWGAIGVGIEGVPGGGTAHDQDMPSEMVNDPETAVTDGAATRVAAPGAAKLNAASVN